MKYRNIKSFFLFLIIILIGCKYDYSENYYIIDTVAPRPAFEQVFAFFTLDEAAIEQIRTIYNSMTDEELVDLKYNYYSAIPVFGVTNNNFNPQNTIQYRGNAIYIRGTVNPDNFERLFLAAVDAYKKDALNQLT